MVFVRFFCGEGGKINPSRPRPLPPTDRKYSRDTSWFRPILYGLWSYHDA